LKQTSFCFFLSSGRAGARAWTGAPLPDVNGCYVSSGIWLYCRKYYFSDRVPIGCEVGGCAVKANFSSTELLRETTIAMSSSYAREMTLQVLPLSLN